MGFGSFIDKEMQFHSYMNELKEKMQELHRNRNDSRRREALLKEIEKIAAEAVRRGA